MAAETKYQTALPFNKKWTDNSSIVENAIHFHAEQIQKRKQPNLDDKKTIADLLLAIRCTDLTTLAGDDCELNVERLTKKALRPLRAELIGKLTKGGHLDRAIPLTTAAVCVYPAFVPTVCKTIELSGTPDRSVAVAAVAAGFPSGLLSSLRLRCEEIKEAIALGAVEIDVVIVRWLVLAGKWEQLYTEVAAMREACGDRAKLKVIIEVGELATLDNVYTTSMIVMNAGADFIKTSTGKAAVNATLAYGTVMMRAIWTFHRETGRKIGFKAAGGIKSARDALDWLRLLYLELGNDWLSPTLFRFGASSLLGELEKDLFKSIFGQDPMPCEISA